MEGFRQDSVPVLRLGVGFAALCALDAFAVVGLMAARESQNVK